MFPLGTYGARKGQPVNEPQLNSCYSTMLLLTLKEIRLERNMHQGRLAEHTGKSPSAWTKIENGQTPLTTDALFGACSALMLQPSYLLNLVERLVPVFQSAGCHLHLSGLSEGEDDVLRLMLRYFSSPGYEFLRSNPFWPEYSRLSVTNIGLFGNPYYFPTVVRYCCEPAFQKWLDEGLQGSGNAAAAPPAPAPRGLLKLA